MHEDVQLYYDEAKDLMEKAVEHLEEELAKVRAGKASPALVNGITVDYFDNPTPINQVATLKTTDAKTLVITPWEKSMLEPIERAIGAANIGINPQNDGTVVRLVMPPLTEESRMNLVKKTKSIGEQQKVTIRNIRRDANDGIKKLSSDGVAEDALKEGESKVQELTDQFSKTIDKYLDAKESEIMTV